MTSSRSLPLLLALLLVAVLAPPAVATSPAAEVCGDHLPADPEVQEELEVTTGWFTQRFSTGPVANVQAAVQTGHANIAFRMADERPTASQAKRFVSADGHERPSAIRPHWSTELPADMRVVCARTTVLAEDPTYVQDTALTAHLLTGDFRGYETVASATPPGDDPFFLVSATGREIELTFGALDVIADQLTITFTTPTDGGAILFDSLLADSRLELVVAPIEVG